MRSILEWFGLHHTVIRYDARGMGLSDSHVADDSLDAHVLDLRDLLDRLGIERAALFAASYSGPIALAFAGRFPERVSRLITWCSHACYAEVARGLTPVRREQRDALIHLAAVDWNSMIHTYIHQALGWDAGDEADLTLAWPQHQADRVLLAADRLAGFDATADLPNITAPTLILHRPDFMHRAWTWHVALLPASRAPPHPPRRGVGPTVHR
jgi:pimeloyl-ACP methyl ester carboxylesterase